MFVMVMPLPAALDMSATTVPGDPLAPPAPVALGALAPAALGALAPAALGGGFIRSNCELAPAPAVIAMAGVPLSSPHAPALKATKHTNPLIVSRSIQSP